VGLAFAEPTHSAPRATVVIGSLLALIGACVVAPAATFGQAEAPTRKPPWLAYRGSAFSVAFGGAVLLEVPAFSQNAASEQQVGDLSEFAFGQIRALRVGVGGTINFERPWRYIIAGAYRAFDQGFNTDTSQVFTLFDLALAVPIPKLGTMTIGKMKEPISLVRLTPLLWLPFAERPAHLDAILPSRNIGITLSNAFFDQRATFTVGYFNPWLELDVPFSQSNNQVVVRATWLPLVHPDASRVLHLGAGGRYSDAKIGYVQFRGGPEVFFAPKFVDTDSISADHLLTVALEASLINGPLWINSEYVQSRVGSSTAGDQVFHGVHVTAAWLLTGESHGYDRERAVVQRVRPRRNATDGGIGAIEIAAQWSRVDLTTGAIDGGALDRISAGVNWYPTADARFEVNYGYATLDRFGLVGRTHIFQMRLALLIG
jgi:phosphate-selective porin OprO/OprP